QEGPIRRVALQPLDQIVQHGDEPRLERRARQITLAVPVRVWDEVEDQPGHVAPKPKGLRTEVREVQAEMELSRKIRANRPRPHGYEPLISFGRRRELRKPDRI